MPETVVQTSVKSRITKVQHRGINRPMVDPRGGMPDDRGEIALEACAGFWR